MATIEIKDVKGAAAGSAELAESVFGIEPNMHVMHHVVKAQRASWRQGTANTRTRGRFAAAARSRGVRRAPAVLARAPSAHPIGSAAAWCSARTPVPTR